MTPQETSHTQPV
ncbi:hypothetical protein LINPERPRIM_LOCUS39875 [Linum perenne]